MESPEQKPQEKKGAKIAFQAAVLAASLLNPNEKPAGVQKSLKDLSEKPKATVQLPTAGEQVPPLKVDGKEVRFVIEEKEGDK